MMIYYANDTIILTNETSKDFIYKAIHHLNTAPLDSNIIAEMIEHDDGSFDVILNEEALNLESFLS